MAAGMTLLSNAAADLLLATARSVPSAVDRAKAQTALEAIADWTAVIEAALAHGTAGLLCDYLVSEKSAPVPEEIVEAATVYLEYRRAEHDRGARDLGAVLDALTSAGVTALPYKGLVLAELGYARPASRGCRDLDVLIRERDIAATMAALEGLGYRSLHTGLSPRRMREFYEYNGQDMLVAEGRLPVEPHWRLNPRTLHANIDIAPLFDRAGTVTLNGRVVPCPSREDSLLICGMHGSKEEWSRLIWVSDIAELLRGGEPLDWPAIFQRADRAGVRRMLLVGLALAANLGGAILPPAAAHAVRDDNVARRLATEAAGRLFARGGNTPSVYRLSAFRLRMRERLSDRARYVAATLLTARVQHFRFVDLPGQISFLYPLVRLGHDYVALPIWRLTRPRAR